MLTGADLMLATSASATAAVLSTSSVNRVSTVAWLSRIENVCDLLWAVAYAIGPSPRLG